jgi:Zn-dependent protease with chaperone function
MVPAHAADLTTLSRQYSDDMFGAVRELAVSPDFRDLPRVQSVVGRLATALGKGKWTVVVYQLSKMPRSMNLAAFALPGNRIAISDWEATVSTDNALAFMIGHEIGHVELGHQEQTWQAIIRETGIHPARWTDLAARADGTAALARQQEFEADRFGLNLANKAGFDGGAGAEELFNRLSGDAMHPDSDLRLAALGLKH